MSKRVLALTGSLFSIAFIIIVIGSYVIVAQNAVTGEWRADARNESREDSGKIQINFERNYEKGNRNQFWIKL